MAFTTLKSLNAEIKQLEAQKKLVELRDGEVPKALAVLQKYARVLSPAQRRQLAKLIEEPTGANTVTARKAPARSPQGRKLGKVGAKYRLPTGETWSGRGLTPKVFSAWAKSAEGKAWIQSNPGAKFPAANGVVKTSPAKASNKAGKVLKKTTTKAAAKKSVRKITKKATKKV
ncbi:H-NS family nucleoid-associated regulatory protein [Stenotrophomonas sp.]|uniref:H-NS family nucleoid-associated regulatory protein n=1 Tax=Stenotrophomonas sp. TaxID=69392 RepID=UPI0028ADDBE9|nr:H-NS family nucleoid-associated regulatory protein [Stenotrophomonas sp.]